jgi:hypothetical protein
MSFSPDDNVGGERLITSERRPGETIDRALRPSGFDEFVGQKDLNWASISRPLLVLLSPKQAIWQHC